MIGPGWFSRPHLQPPAPSKPPVAHGEHHPRGQHTLIVGEGSHPEVLDNDELLSRVLLEAAQLSGATVIGGKSARFPGQGCTVFLVLAESHISIHTYPEHGTWFADVFTCGQLDPLPAAKFLASALGGQVEMLNLPRFFGFNRQLGQLVKEWVMKWQLASLVAHPN